MNKIEYGKFAANNGVLILIFLIKAIIMPIDVGFCASIGRNESDINATITVNLTAITWDHAVNSQAKLKNALANDFKMIEADVTYGTLIGNKVKLPIMAHGPNEVESDLSLDDFVKQVNEYNNGKMAHKTKGIKLDFKSIEAFTNAQEILAKIAGNYEVWLNADILKGPVDSRTQPVDSKQFLELANKLPKFTLSVGWTTRWTEAGISSGKYTDDNVDEMINALENLPNKQQSITFPVRAGLVATSQTEMTKLLGKFINATLTVWSSPFDEVNATELQKLIKGFGIDKVYLDVPKSLSAKLNLGPEDKPSKSSANKVIHIGLLSIVMLVLMALF